jgi:hypothetical protein
MIFIKDVFPIIKGTELVSDLKISKKVKNTSAITTKNWCICQFGIKHPDFMANLPVFGGASTTRSW